MINTRLACKGLNKPQLDMFVMGQLVAFSHSSEATSTNKKMAHERKSNYHHQGKPSPSRHVQGGQCDWLKAPQESVELVDRQRNQSSGAWQHQEAALTCAEVVHREVSALLC